MKISLQSRMFGKGNFLNSELPKIASFINRVEHFFDEIMLKPYKHLDTKKLFIVEKGKIHFNGNLYNKIQTQIQSMLGDVTLSLHIDDPFAGDRSDKSYFALTSSDKKYVDLVKQIAEVYGSREIVFPFHAITKAARTDINFSSEEARMNLIDNLVELSKHIIKSRKNLGMKLALENCQQVVFDKNNNIKYSNLVFLPHHTADILSSVYSKLAYSGYSLDQICNVVGFCVDTGHANLLGLSCVDYINAVRRKVNAPLFEIHAHGNDQNYDSHSSINETNVRNYRELTYFLARFYEGVVCFEMRLNEKEKIKRTVELEKAIRDTRNILNDIKSIKENVISL